MCSKKCACVTFIFIYIAIDILINLLLMTEGLVSLKNYYFLSNPTIYADLVIDVWLISFVRDIFLLITVLFVLINHRFIHNFIKLIHQKYLSAFLTLSMYSYAMIKLLIHADARKTIPFNVLINIWNIIAAFLFFIFWYSLSLLKVNDYKKTNIDGGDAENADDNDIFLGKN